MMNLFAPVLTIVLLQFGAAIGSQLRPDESKRGLQGDFSIESMDFSMAGVYFTPEVAQEACPEQWQGLVSCIIQSCPTLFEDCPTSSSSEFNKTLDWCGNFQSSFCDQYVTEAYPNCCMNDCFEPLRSLTACVAASTGGEDYSACPPAEECIPKPMDPFITNVVVENSTLPDLAYNNNMTTTTDTSMVSMTSTEYALLMNDLNLLADAVESLRGRLQKLGEGGM